MRYTYMLQVKLSCKIIVVHLQDRAGPRITAWAQYAYENNE